IAFVAVGLGLRLIDGAILLLPALTILVLAPEYFSPIKQVGKDYHATLDGQIAMDEIDTFIQQDLPEIDKENEKLLKNNWTTNSELTLTNINVEIEEENLLKNVNVTVQDGFTGLIGTSGAGKTTLLQVLAGRLKPSSGTVTLNGHELVSLQDSKWFEQVAYIPQHPYIFPLTLADNIRFYQPNATDEAVKSIITEIGLEEFVATLPNGIHEKNGEGVRILSGGQEQRVAIARALLSEKQIILLDEPTAHLDIETEYEVKQLVLRLFQHKCVFLATHRLHWLKEMDYIYEMEHGKVVHSGTYDTY